RTGSLEGGRYKNEIHRDRWYANVPEGVAQMSVKTRLAAMAFVVAAGLGAVASGFAQAQHHMQLKVEPPKATVTPTGSWLPKSVSYIKASNTNKDDQFGGAVALSGDGNTLAVGAVNEDGAGKGVNPVVKAGRGGRGGGA